MTQQHSATPGTDPVLAMIRKAGLAGFVDHRSAKSSAPSKDPVLALVHAAGLRGFEPGAARNPTPSKDPVLALIGASGLAGFKSGEVRTPSPINDPVVALIHASGLSGFAHDEQAAESADVDPVLDLIAKAGLPGFKAREVREPEATKTAVKKSSAAPPTQTEAEVVKSAPPRTKRLSKLDYAVVHIAAIGGAEALASLEERMGRPMAADLPDGACYSVQQHEDGSSTRAFAMMSHERLMLAPIVGELGSPALRLSFEPIDVKAYQRKGPGATGRSAQGEPMQMADAACRALVGALR